MGLQENGFDFVTSLFTDIVDGEISVLPAANASTRRTNLQTTTLSSGTRKQLAVKPEGRNMAPPLFFDEIVCLYYVVSPLLEFFW